jgi:hypothetical protein
MTILFAKDKGLWWEVEGKDCTISVEPRPAYCDRGNYIAKLHPTPGSMLAREIDAHDGWPRYYFTWNCMVEEIAAWLKKRGQLK